MIRTIIRDAGKSKKVIQVGALNIQRTGPNWYFWCRYHQAIVYATHPTKPIKSNRSISVTPFPDQFDDPELSRLVVASSFRGIIKVLFQHSYSGCGYFNPKDYEIHFLKADKIRLHH